MNIGVKILTTLMEEVLAVHQKPERIRKVIMENDRGITEFDLEEGTMTINFFNGWVAKTKPAEQTEEEEVENALRAWERSLKKDKRIEVHYMDILGQERIVELNPQELLEVFERLKKEFREPPSGEEAPNL